MGALTARRVVAVCATLGLLALLSLPAFAEGRRPKMDRGVAARVGTSGTSRVIVRSEGGADLAGRLRAAGARLGVKLQIVDAYVADVPNDQLEALSLDPGVAGVHLDRPVAVLLSTTSHRRSTTAAGRWASA